MSVTSGFFNSQNGDRRYTAEQFSELISNLIIDGVFSNVGTAFSVKADSGSNITVGIGRAWFNGIWIYNDALYPMTVRNAEIILNRIDAVVIEVNHSETVRSASIKFVNGTPSSTPVRPELTNTDEIHQYPLAYIYRKAGVDDVTQADITNMIGTSACPYVMGILETQNIDKVVEQWQAQFNLWFEGVQGQLDGDVAAKLANQIIEINAKFKSLASDQAVYEDIEDSSGNPITDSSNSNLQGRTVFSLRGEKEYTVIEAGETKDEKYKVGDVLVTARTDLGSDWLLCNGDPILPSLYPKLCELKTLQKGIGGYWKLKTTISASPYGFTSVDYYDGVWVGLAVGSDSFILYKSTDGVAWTRIASSSSFYARAVRCINGRWVVYGQVGSYAQPGIFIQDDVSKSWTTITLDTSHSFAVVGVAYNNGTWYAMVQGKDYGTYLYTSTNPVATWNLSARPVPTPYINTDINLSDFRFENGRFVGVGYHRTNNMYPAVIYSTNPLSSWSCELLTSYAYRLSHVQYHNGYWIAYGVNESSTYYNNRIFLSTSPGDSWSAVDLGTKDVSINDTWYHDGLFVAMGTSNDTVYVFASKAPGQAMTKYTVIENAGSISMMAIRYNEQNGTWFMLGRKDNNPVQYVHYPYLLPTISLDSVYAYIKARG